MRKKVAICLSFILLLTPLDASNLTSKKNQLNNNKENIKEAKNELETTKEQKEKIQAEIKRVDTEIVTLQDKINTLETERTQKQAELEISEEELAIASEKKEEQYEATKRRMVQMYKNKKIGYIQIIFSSGSFWEAINRIEYIKRISEQDNNLLDNYEKQIADIEIQKAKIEKDKTELDQLYSQQLAKQDELEVARSAKSSTINKLAGEEEKLQAQIKEMEQASKQLEQEIKRLTQSSTLKYSGGKFGWPVPGFYRLSSEYNPRNSPISGKYEFHSGIDIPASYGSPIVAAADGVVITSGWINGYGYTVMINHGSGLVSLYGHNSSLVASVGQTVKKGQTVAKAGSTGYSTGNHCHFEVRVNGSHVSPWQYLNKN